ERSRTDANQAGRGTTVTAVYVGADEAAIAHVGDSRAYLLRDGELRRLTEDHSLVEELLRQGKLTAEEASEHPQKSIITRALGPEPVVEVDRQTVALRDGDVFLLCSDGLTSMVDETQIERMLTTGRSLPDVGKALVAGANDAGGRDNITVVLFRVEEIDGAARAAVEQATAAGPTAPRTQDVASAVATAQYKERQAAPPPATPRRPRARAAPAPARRRRMPGAAKAAIALVVVLVPASLLVTAGFTAVFVERHDLLSNLSLTVGAVFLGLCLAAHFVIRFTLPYADPYLFPLVALLACFGLVMIYRIDQDLAREQAQWFVVGLILFA